MSGNLAYNSDSNTYLLNNGLIMEGCCCEHCTVCAGCLSLGISISCPDFSGDNYINIRLAPYSVQSCHVIYVLSNVQLRDNNANLTDNLVSGFLITTGSGYLLAGSFSIYASYTGDVYDSTSTFGNLDPSSLIGYSGSACGPWDTLLSDSAGGVEKNLSITAIKQIDDPDNPGETICAEGEDVEAHIDIVVEVEQHLFRDPINAGNSRYYKILNPDDLPWDYCEGSIDPDDIWDGIMTAPDTSSSWVYTGTHLGRNFSITLDFEEMAPTVPEHPTWQLLFSCDGGGDRPAINMTSYLCGPPNGVYGSGIEVETYN
jgi:hypothetical protein